MRSRRRARWVAVAGAIAVAAGSSFAAEATSGTPSREQVALQVGKQQYLKYCATCHGPNGTGDGVAAHLFKSKPTDLTTLAERNGGTFPMNELLNIVKGNAPIAAHGTREMPVWGEILGRPLDTSMNQQAVDNAEILVIGHYLESIQKK